MATGQWGEAFTNSPFAAGLFIFTVVIFFWNTAGLLTGVRIRAGDRLRFWHGHGKALTITVLALLALNWIYRIIFGLD